MLQEDKMNECCGWFGSIFGHCFKSFSVKSEVVFPTRQYSGFEVATLAEQFFYAVRPQTNEAKEVVCKRCGKRPDQTYIRILHGKEAADEKTHFPVDFGRS